MLSYRAPALKSPNELLYGLAPQPVTTRAGLVIGGGTVYPELNFTLPPMLLTDATFGKACEHYRQMASEALRRAAELHVPGVVLEYETVPDLTRRPAWGAEIGRILLQCMAEARDRYSLASALRVTPNDNREMVRPPRMRSGEHWETMLELFEQSAADGADMLSIESVGGKELHDDALTSADLPAVIFAQCIMGVRDMRFLWREIVEIAHRHDAIAAGDTACGFANTAMVLADRGMIPKVFAAVVRAVSAVRSLEAYRCGAVGPGKDCGYENIILKAITGCPMSLEGKAAACAHLSPIGNLPMGVGDLWSNESVQNVKLLGGMAPTVSMEQLAYDCRLLNTAAAHGEAARRGLRDWLVESDAAGDPQAWILTPESAWRLACVITEADADGPYAAGLAAAREAIAMLREAIADGALGVDAREPAYLDAMTQQLDALPAEESAFIREMMDKVDQSKFVAGDYNL